MKSSFVDCKTCDAKDFHSSILETNSNKNMSEVELIIVTDYPSTPMDLEKSVPISNKSIRKYIDGIKSKCKFLITNTVMCVDVNPNTERIIKPNQKTIDLCKTNSQKIIEQCKPKVIILMGDVTLNSFGFENYNLEKHHGNIFSWGNYGMVLLIPGIDQIKQNFNLEKVLENEFQRAIELVQSETLYDINDQISTQTNKIEFKQHKTGSSGIHYYKIPDKYYTDEYRLIDVQYSRGTNTVIYIFRDKNNNKIYHETNDNFVCYQSNNPNSVKIVPYDQLNQIQIPYQEKSSLDPNITYEGDVKLTAKHAMDYYHFNKGECPKTHDNFYFTDIEIDVGLTNRGFPNPTEAAYPICMITSYYNGQIYCYVVDNGTEPIIQREGIIYYINKSEKAVLQKFVNDFKMMDPDFISGWNAISFDMEYIYNRLPKVGIDRNSLSKYNEFYCDGANYRCKLLGCTVVDQLYLYKQFTFTARENYKLGTIAQIEVKETKRDLPLPFNEMYWKKLNEMIEYNIQDTLLLVKLENKLGHINLLNEIRNICTTSFESGSSILGQVDSIFVSYLRERNLASKNTNPNIEKEKFPGAFVLPPTPGTYDNVTDFDFTALYPSEIMTYNIGVNTFVMEFVDYKLGYYFAYDQNSLPNEIQIILDPMNSRELKTFKKQNLLDLIKEHDYIVTINGAVFKNHKEEKSVYLEVLQGILDGRKIYKKKMLQAKVDKDEFHVNLYNTRQLVYKVLANSAYGAIANAVFRFFNTRCAAAITLSGQESLKNSIIEAQAYMEKMDKHIPDSEFERPAKLRYDEMYNDIEDFNFPTRKLNYIVTGDTDSIFCCFEKFKCDKSPDNIIQMCDEIQTFLNETVMKEMVARHNVAFENNRLNLKNEFLIARGLFLAKKRYALHVIRQEGKIIDEMDYKGIEIKRSDFSSASKEFLKELLNLVLKSEKISFMGIMNYVKSKERDFRTLIAAGDKSVARPVSFTKKLEDYKMIPQGVVAMQNWNDLLYQAHSTGSKAYMYKIRGLDTTLAPPEVVENYRKFCAEGRKLEVVAIPDEEQKLPNYFIIDTKAALSFNFTERYKLLLDPLIQVRQSSTLMEF